MTASASRTAKPNRKPERKNLQPLDRPSLRGTYLQPGSNLDENPGSDLSENQHIYDPALSVFHSPLQLAPSDLYASTFYARRHQAIEARLSTLQRPDDALAIMRRNFEIKRGLANPFVSWHEDLPDIMDVLLRRLPPAGLAAALRHLAQDVGRHGRGLPDLFLWTESEYRFVEVKAENDHLAPHQYEWLQVLGKAGLQVEVQRVRRPPKNQAVERQ